jgi:hypothetical protein
MTTYVYRNGEWVDKETLVFTVNKASAKFTVIKDTPEYVSPMSGKLVSSRRERREEMKVYNVREVETSECKLGYKNKRFMAKHGITNERASERKTIL